MSSSINKEEGIQEATAATDNELHVLNPKESNVAEKRKWSATDGSQVVNVVDNDSNHTDQQKRQNIAKSASKSNPTTTTRASPSHHHGYHPGYYPPPHYHVGYGYGPLLPGYYHPAAAAGLPESRCYYALRKGRYHRNCIFFDKEDMTIEVDGYDDAEYNVFFNIATAAGYIDVARPSRYSTSTSTTASILPPNNNDKTPPKKKRGRPRKTAQPSHTTTNVEVVKPVGISTSTASSNNDDQPPPKRKRGRPRKTVQPSNTTNNIEVVKPVGISTSTTAEVSRPKLTKTPAKPPTKSSPVEILGTMKTAQPLPIITTTKTTTVPTPTPPKPTVHTTNPTQDSTIQQTNNNQDKKDVDSDKSVIVIDDESDPNTDSDQDQNNQKDSESQLNSSSTTTTLKSTSPPKRKGSIPKGFVLNKRRKKRFTTVKRKGNLSYKGSTIRLGTYKIELERRDALTKAKLYLEQWELESRSKEYVLSELERLGIRRVNKRGRPGESNATPLPINPEKNIDVGTGDVVGISNQESDTRLQSSSSTTAAATTSTVATTHSQDMSPYYTKPFKKDVNIYYRGHNIYLGSFETEEAKRDVMAKVRPYILQWTSEKRDKKYAIDELERLGIRQIKNDDSTSDEATDDEDNTRNRRGRNQYSTRASEFNKTCMVGFRHYAIYLGSCDNEESKKEMQAKARPYLQSWAKENRSKEYAISELERLGIRNTQPQRNKKTSTEIKYEMILHEIPANRTETDDDGDDNDDNDDASATSNNANDGNEIIVNDTTPTSTSNFNDAIVNDIVDVSATSDPNTATAATSHLLTPTSLRRTNPKRNCSTRKKLSDNIHTEYSSSDDESDDDSCDETKMTAHQLNLHKSWNKMYNRLIKYRKNHGTYRVSKDVDNELAKWIAYQGRSYNSFKKNESTTTFSERRFTVLNPQRIQKLQDLGFEFRAKDSAEDKANAKWEQRYEELKQFKLDHGDCDLINHSTETLHKWAQTQRDQYANLREGTTSTLTMQRIQKLNDVGFKWEKKMHKTYTFEERLAQLKNFKENHGHCKVPRHQTGLDGLDSWTQGIRAKRKAMLKGDQTNLTEEQVQTLDEMGFLWEVIKPGQRQPIKSWEERLKDLINYKEEHDTTQVPQSVPGLGLWVRKNRAHYRLMKKGRRSEMTQERALKLAEIGFAFEVTPRKSLASPPEEDIPPVEDVESAVPMPVLHPNGLDVVDNVQHTESNAVPNNSISAYDETERWNHDLNDLPPPDFRFDT